MLTESPTCDTLSHYSAKPNLHHTDFFCHAPEAKRVSIIGDFNNWEPNATPMIRQPDGRWMTSLDLNHGHPRKLPPDENAKSNIIPFEEPHYEHTPS